MDCVAFAIEKSSHLGRFLRGQLLPWHTPPWQKFGRANAFQIKVLSSQLAEWKDNLSILSKPDKAFPRERKWLCEYHSAWPSLGTLKYSLFEVEFFSRLCDATPRCCGYLMMTKSSLSKIPQSENFSWETMLTKLWNLQKKATIKMLWTIHILFRRGSGFRIINTFHCLPSYS